MAAMPLSVFDRLLEADERFTMLCRNVFVRVLAVAAALPTACTPRCVWLRAAVAEAAFPLMVSRRFATR